MTGPSLLLRFLVGVGVFSGTVWYGETERRAHVLNVLTYHIISMPMGALYLRSRVRDCNVFCAQVYRQLELTH